MSKFETAIVRLIRLVAFFMMGLVVGKIIAKLLAG